MSSVLRRYLSLELLQYWLVITLVLSVLASWLPSRRAVSVSVRESLAYQ